MAFHIQTMSPHSAPTVHRGIPLTGDAFASGEGVHLPPLHNVSFLPVSTINMLILLQVLNYHNADQHGPMALMSEAFQTRPSSSMIDPALISLPNTADADLQDPVEIMKAKGRKAARKVAGARAKEKPYSQKESSSKKTQLNDVNPNGEEEDDDTKEKRGRPAGRSNFKKDDVSMLLKVVREVMPIGNISWSRAADLYNEWAKHHRRQERPFKSLEVKFKAVCFFTSILSNIYELTLSICSWCAPRNQRGVAPFHGRWRRHAKCRSLLMPAVGFAPSTILDGIQAQMKR